MFTVFVFPVSKSDLHSLLYQYLYQILSAGTNRGDGTNRQILDRSKINGMPLNSY